MYDVFIKNGSESLIKAFPNIITADSGNRVKLDSQRVILTNHEDKLAVGVTVEARVRLFTPTAEGFEVTEKREIFGEYEYVPCDSALGDIVGTINKLGDIITNKIVAWG